MESAIKALQPVHIPKDSLGERVAQYDKVSHLALILWLSRVPHMRPTTRKLADVTGIPQAMARSSLLKPRGAQQLPSCPTGAGPDAAHPVRHAVRHWTPLLHQAGRRAHMLPCRSWP